MIPILLLSIQERPANRVEIDSLDRELEDRVKAVLYEEMKDLGALDKGYLHQPHQDSMLLIRNRMLEAFNVSVGELSGEVWLGRLIKCECLKEVCDHVASVLNDMLSVTSSELGSVLRKLRYTYNQSFEQMNISTKQLHAGYIDSKADLDRCSFELDAVKRELASKEEGAMKIVGEEVLKVTAAFEKQRAVDQATISQVRTALSSTLHFDALPPSP